MAVDGRGKLARLCTIICRLLPRRPGPERAEQALKRAYENTILILSLANILILLAFAVVIVGGPAAETIRRTLLCEEHLSLEIMAFILVLVPAYIANGAPNFCVKKVGGEKRLRRLCRGPWLFRRERVTPIAPDLLGANKTVEGLVIGVLAGMIGGLAALLLFVAADRLLGTGFLSILEGVASGMSGPVAALLVSGCALLVGFYAGLLTMIGDMAGSCIKRKCLRIPPGQPAPILDQVDFYIPQLLVLFWVYLLLAASTGVPDLSLAHALRDVLSIYIFGLILTFNFHIASNCIFKRGRVEEPCL